MKKHKNQWQIKEPKKTIGLLLIIYSCLGTAFIIENVRQQQAETFTGLSTTGIVSINIIQQCSIPLYQGFNMISLCANVTDRNISSVLSPISGKYEFVLRLNKTNQEFSTYSPNAEQNAFSEFEFNESYFIFMDENTVLNIAGSELGDMNISLVPEFNAASYPYIFAGNVTRYLSKIKENVSFVLKWNATRQDAETYSSEAAQPEFEIMNKGEGQLLYMTESGILRYNKSGLQP